MLAIISGSGVLPLFADAVPLEVPPLRFGAPSGQPRRAEVDGRPLLVLPRHGVPHHVAPHRINYRANIELLAQLGATRIVALTTVGGITPEAAVGRIVVPQQLIDYTWGRAHTFIEDDAVSHADFADPFDERLRAILLRAGRLAQVDLHDGGVYGCTQGPRFETAAEIERMARDGCTLVGMTGMPEAGLAREQTLPYAMLSLVVNPAAGRARDPFDLAAIGRVMTAGMRSVEAVLRQAVSLGL